MPGNFRGNLDTFTTVCGIAGIVLTLAAKNLTHNLWCQHFCEADGGKFMLLSGHRAFSIPSTSSLGFFFFFETIISLQESGSFITIFQIQQVLRRPGAQDAAKEGEDVERQP